MVYALELLLLIPTTKNVLHYKECLALQRNECFFTMLIHTHYVIEVLYLFIFLTIKIDSDGSYLVMLFLCMCVLVCKDSCLQDKGNMHF